MLVVAERKARLKAESFDKFGMEMEDGRLTEPSDGKEYRLREAIMLAQKLGRALTDEEMKNF